MFSGVKKREYEDDKKKGKNQSMRSNPKALITCHETSTFTTTTTTTTTTATTATSSISLL